jgi:hypothetical protein
MWTLLTVYKADIYKPGADPRFQVRGVGGCALKKIAPRGGRREKFLVYFVRKITILHQNIIFFPNFRGGCAGASPPPGSAPAIVSIDKTIYQGRIQDLWLEGVCRRGVPSWSRVAPWLEAPGGNAP